MPIKKIVALVVVALAAFCAIAGLASTADRSSNSVATFAPLAGTLAPTEVADEGDTVVHVGLYGTNVYELSFEDNTFYFSGYVWMRWRGDLAPTSTLEFVNAVETWGLMITPLTEEPELLPNGEYVQTLSVQGRFYKAFALGDYPLDSQELSIMLEDTTNTADKIVYRVDETMSGIDPTMRVQGFEVAGLSSQNYLHSYGTDFGYSGTAEDQDYSALEFQIHIDRNPNLFLWKLLFPLMLVLITNWLTLVINPSYVEVRTAMPATALLTTVFLQLSAMESVAQSATLVLMDQIYLVAYAAIVLTLAQVIWDNRTQKSEDDDRIVAIAKRDRISLAVQGLTTLAVLLALILPRLI